MANKETDEQETKDTIVSIENLSFSYEGGITALRNVSFELKKGEFLVVMGPNGAGKTTLCYIISGVIPNMYGGTRKGLSLIHI